MQNVTNATTPKVKDTYDPVLVKIPKSKCSFQDKVDYRGQNKADYKRETTAREPGTTTEAQPPQRLKTEQNRTQCDKKERAQSKQAEIDKSHAEWWAEVSQAKTHEHGVLLQPKGPAPKYRRALAPFSTVSQQK